MAPAAVVELPVEADECSACAERLRDGLAHHRGVLAVEPSRDGAGVSVRYDPDLCSLDCLGSAAAGLRVDLEGAYAHRVCRVEGMDCADCAQTIERAVARVPGVTSVAVSFPTETLRVEYRPAAVAPETIAARVRRLGYDVAGLGAAPASGRLRLPGRTVTSLAATALLLVALSVDLLTDRAAAPLYALSVLVGGLPLARSGVAALLATRRPDINLLMALAAVGAAAIGAWLEAALVVVLFSIGELLEGRAVDRARRELTGLVALAPATARVRRRASGDGLPVLEEHEVPVADLAVGEAVVVRPGERIPVDGVVSDGAGAVDQSAVTGESLPVEVEAGSAVFAGTLNGQGLLVVTSTSEPGDTTLDRVARLVTEAQARKSPSERWVDTFARWYTPAVIGLAAVVGIGLPLAGRPVDEAVYSALALLILACPCALVVSTPVAIVSALGRSSAAGVLVKGGAHLERAAAIRAVAFDKTGTLTAGRPEVVDVEGVAADASVALRAAASVEQGSEHPLARAVVRAAEDAQLALGRLEGFEALVGLGARGVVDGRATTVGDSRLLPVADPAVERSIAELAARGRTVVLVEQEGVLLGVLGLADGVRPEAAEAIASLHALGVAPVTMLTGDAETTAAAVASELGLDEVHARLLPVDKAAVVAGLPGPVAMVGDGVNDAPALAAADLGIALAGVASDTAVEIADAAVMGDDPRKVAGLIGLARWTRAVVRQNVAVSLGTKLVAAGILAAGALPLWGAVVADVGASLVVVGNGLRLVRGRPHGRLRGLPLP